MRDTQVRRSMLQDHRSVPAIRTTNEHRDLSVLPSKVPAEDTGYTARPLALHPAY